MRTVMIVSFLCLAAGCNTSASRFDETAYGINRAPNTAPRGSDAFCRVYAEQTTANRIETSEGSDSRGPSGFDKFLAGREGKRAFDRCKAGRTS